jgi:hypothetical protein
MDLDAGEVGATCVLGRIMDDPFTGRMILLELEQIGVWGEQIWLMHRDVHGMDLDSLIQHVKAQAGERHCRRV